MNLNPPATNKVFTQDTLLTSFLLWMMWLVHFIEPWYNCAAHQIRYLQKCHTSCKHLVIQRHEKSFNDLIDFATGRKYNPDFGPTLNNSFFNSTFRSLAD